MKQLPKHIKENQGTLRPSREAVNPLSFQPLTKIPKPDKLTDKIEIEYYNYYCGLLLSINLLSAADIPYIQKKVVWFRLHDEAMEMINKEGYYQTSDKSGWSQVNGHVQMLERCEKQIDTFCSKYGFTLVDRQKIDIPKPKSDDDDLLK